MVRWGIAGCGWVARDYVAPAIRESANGRLTALYDLSATALAEAGSLFAEAARYTELSAFLAAIDAVYIAAPNNAHRSLTEAAARAGVPVLCEKPMATSLADAQAMATACDRAGVLYATAFDQRFHPAHRRLAALVAEGALGTVTALRIVYCCWVGADFAGDNWRIDPARAGGGALMDLGPHGLDLASYLLGEPLLDVAAMGQRLVHDYPVEDGAVLIARSASGVLVQLHVAYNCPETLPRRRLEIIGTAGQVTATDTMGQTPGGTLHFTSAATGEARAIEIPSAARSPFLNQAEAFAACVLDGTPFGFSPQRDLAIMDLVMRAQRQAHPELHHAA
jgi:predicted dehydrogenase